jgi:hypothetical protein
MTLFVGDDWAEDHHDIHLMDAEGAKLASRRLPEGLAGIGGFHDLVGACQDFCVCGWSEVGVDAVGVGGRELGEGLFPVGGDLSFDEAA